MLPVLLAALAPLLGKVLEKIPNAGERDKAKQDFELALQSQEVEILRIVLQSDLAQAEINKTEAASESLFKSGWRPFVGWVCASGFAWATVFQPVLVFILAVFHHEMVTPQLQTEVLMQALFGLLGLGGMRMMEKKWGVASK